MDQKVNPLQAAAQRRMPAMVIELHIGHGEPDGDEAGFGGESEPSDAGESGDEECEEPSPEVNKKPKEKPYPGQPQPSKPASK